MNKNNIFDNIKLTFGVFNFLFCIFFHILLLKTYQQLSIINIFAKTTNLIWSNKFSIFGLHIFNFTIIVFLTILSLLYLFFHFYSNKLNARTKYFISKVLLKTSSLTVIAPFLFIIFFTFDIKIMLYCTYIFIAIVWFNACFYNKNFWLKRFNRGLIFLVVLWQAIFYISSLSILNIIVILNKQNTTDYLFENYDIMIWLNVFGLVFSLILNGFISTNKLTKYYLKFYDFLQKFIIWFFYQYIIFTFVFLYIFSKPTLFAKVFLCVAYLFEYKNDDAITAIFTILNIMIITIALILSLKDKTTTLNTKNILQNLIKLSTLWTLFLTIFYILFYSFSVCKIDFNSLYNPTFLSYIDIDINTAKKHLMLLVSTMAYLFCIVFVASIFVCVFTKKHQKLILFFKKSLRYLIYVLITLMVGYLSNDLFVYFILISCCISIISINKAISPSTQNKKKITKSVIKVITTIIIISSLVAYIYYMKNKRYQEAFDEVGIAVNTTRDILIQNNYCSNRKDCNNKGYVFYDIKGKTIKLLIFNNIHQDTKVLNQIKEELNKNNLKNGVDYQVMFFSTSQKYKQIIKSDDEANYIMLIKGK